MKHYNQLVDSYIIKLISQIIEIDKEWNQTQNEIDYYISTLISLRIQKDRIWEGLKDQKNFNINKIYLHHTVGQIHYQIEKTLKKLYFLLNHYQPLLKKVQSIKNKLSQMSDHVEESKNLCFNLLDCLLPTKDDVAPLLDDIITGFNIDYNLKRETYIELISLNENGYLDKNIERFITSWQRYENNNYQTIETILKMEAVVILKDWKSSCEQGLRSLKG